MTTPKQRFPSFAHTISALGIVLYCVGFLRIELELKNHKKRLNSLENAANSIDPPSSGPNVMPEVIKNSHGMYYSHYLDTVENRFLCSLKGQSLNSFPEAVERMVKCSPMANR